MSLLSTCRLVGAAAAAAVFALPLFAQDQHMLIDRQPAYAGPGWRAAPSADPDAAPPTSSNNLGFTSSGVVLQAWLSMADLGLPSEEGNDCWGYTSPSGREYALIGTTTDTVFVEVTNPSNPQVLAHIDGPNSLWRDVKVFNDRAYIVNENSGGIQVVSLTSIDSGSVSVVGSAGSGATHNIAIDEVSGYAYRTGGGSNGLRIYDLNANPNSPPQVGTYSARYVHDAQVVTYTSGPLSGRQIAYCCAGLNGGGTDTGLTVLDVTNKASIVTISQVPYPNREYSHQGWLSEDRQWFYLGDELDEPPLSSTTYVFDVSDPDNASYVTSFTNGNPAITHNFYVKGDLLYEANYRSGMRVFDISNPTNPVETAFFDTYPANDNANYNGLWSLFPYFDSGTVIGSDVERGLFVWRVTDESLTISVPGGPPAILDPAGDSVGVTISEANPGDLMPGSELLYYDAGAGFVSTPLMNNGGGSYDAAFPALSCGTGVSWYIEAMTIGGLAFTAPEGAPGSTYSSTVALGVNTAFADDMESGTNGWTVGFPGDAATTGIWVRVDPVGTAAQPEDDHTPAPGVNAWITGQHTSGGAGANDVDGGATTLLSPMLDLSGTVDPTIAYWRWYSNETGVAPNADIFEVFITDDGGATWAAVETVGPQSPGLAWMRHSFRALDIPGISLTSQVQLRFRASDLGAGSIVEAGVDDLEVVDVVCNPGLGTPYCVVANNSTSQAARLVASGSASVAANDLTLEADRMPTNQFGYFLASRNQGFIQNPGGSTGNLCLANPIARYASPSQIQNTGAAGAFSLMIDLTAIPLSPPAAVLPGETWNFQAWYRDNVLGVQTSNFTNGYSILFQ